MKNDPTRYILIALLVLVLVGIPMFNLVYEPQEVLAATVVTEYQDNTMPAQLYMTDSAHGTCSSVDPETFSIAIAEEIYPWNTIPSAVIGKYDAMILFYQISTVTDNWIIETDYFYVDTNSNNKRDSFQCTATGADSGSPWHLYMLNWYGI